MKGFQFTRYVKAFETLNFTEHDAIYGDSFTIMDDAVQKIGNNVSILFRDMDFGENGATTIELCRRSQQANSVRIVFTDIDGCEVINTVQVPGAWDYESIICPLETPLIGQGYVTFIFLPGCDIDLSWLKFM